MEFREAVERQEVDLNTFRGGRTHGIRNVQNGGKVGERKRKNKLNSDIEARGRDKYISESEQ